MIEQALAADALTGIRLQALPPLALYVHLPWCVRKCPYCDFNSHEWRQSGADLPEQETGVALIVVRADVMKAGVEFRRWQAQIGEINPPERKSIPGPDD